MEWIKAVAVAELREDERQVVEIRGHKILLLMHEGQAYAVLNSCPHMGVPLRGGTITEDRAIVCPFHHSTFDLESGEVQAWAPWPPVVGKLLGRIKPEQPLRTYPTKVERGAIWVGVGSDADASR
jgi:nitrite reductase/ring-hydroxylating ferredoxin subunit